MLAQTAPGASSQISSSLADDRIPGTQRTFRAVLDAMARPGTVRRLTWRPAIATPPLDQHAPLIALLLTLIDHEVSLAMSPRPALAGVADAMVRWTRTELTTPERADFVVVERAGLDGALLRGLRRGSLAYPDDSATLIVLADGLSDGESGAGDLLLSGPGIDGERRVRNGGLTPELVSARREVVRQYPTGLDLLLMDAAGRLLGLPRTTRIQLANERED